MELSREFNPANVRPSINVSEETLQLFQASVAAGSPFLQSLYNRLKQDYGTLDGIGYALTNDNVMASNWLQQTPDVWGQTGAAVKIGAGDFIVDDIYQLVSGAQTFIDITSLYPYPDGQFKAAIINGLIDLANSGRAVKVRILVGWYPGALKGNQSDYLKDLIAPLIPIKNGKLEIYVGAQRTEDQMTWNHAKMVAVDGKKALLGGENLWDGDYLEAEPVHDLNVMLEGSFVFHMHKFADAIWKSVCDYKLSDLKPAYWKSGDAGTSNKCLSKSLTTPVPGKGTLSILGAGRFGDMMDNGNPADLAMALSLLSAQSIIRIAQQDIGSYGFYWEPCLHAIAKALLKKLDVYLVISNDYGKAGSGNSYSTDTVAKTAEKIREFISLDGSAPKGKALNDLLCSKLHLSTLRFGPSDEWPNGYEFANHSKFFMVDDKVFYVGSENLYPSDLIEYGVFISDPVAIKQMRENYWDQLWKYSSRVAISGSGSVDCYFQE